MSNTYGQQDPSRRLKGIVVVLIVHALIGYALISGMARQGLNLIKKPLEAVVIQEVMIPPPPPPPKKIEAPKEAPKLNAPPPPYVPPPDVAPAAAFTAPVMVATATPPPAPVVIAPPPPPPPVSVAPKPNRSDMAVACPTQVPPEMPRKALQDGTEGVVKAQALIKDGSVKEVTILSGPRVFHAAVRAAMLQYKCSQDATEVLAVQEFNFRIE